MAVVRIASLSLLVLLAAALVSAGVPTARSFVDGSPSASPAADSVGTPMATPVARRVTAEGVEISVVEDTVKGLMCVVYRGDNNSGRGCTNADTTDLFFSMGYGWPDTTTIIVVVDPQRRLDRLRLLVHGEWLEAVTTDGGLTVAAVVDAPPDQFVALDRDGHVLMSMEG